MPFDFSLSLAMIPFDLVILLNLMLSYRAPDPYRRAMRACLVILIAVALADVGAGIWIARGMAGANLVGGILFAFHGAAFLAVAGYLTVFVMQVRTGRGAALYTPKQARETADGEISDTAHGEAAHFTRLQKALLVSFLPTLALIIYIQRVLQPGMMLYVFYFSVLTYAFYFSTEIPVYAQLRKRLRELSVAVGEAEEAEQRAAAEDLAKNEFLTNMSHEIRTPLNAILGMDEMILRESREEHVTDYAQDIRDAGNSLLAIINDILDFSRIEGGSLEIAHTPYHLGHVLETVCNMIQLRADDKSLAFAQRINESIPDLLEGDGQRISQVLINLLNNAVKYTNEGSVTFTVRAEETEAGAQTSGAEKEARKTAGQTSGGGAHEAAGETPGAATRGRIMLHFEVADTGIGIREENLETLFESFMRFDEQRNRSIEGTGLGLAITHNLVQMMEGTISVSSEYGKGSVFTVCIPQRVLDGHSIGEYVHEEKNDREGITRRFFAPAASVLAIDDTKSNLTVVVHLLKQTQMRVDTAQSGEEGLALFAAHPYDVVLLDHMMPGMDGIETLHAMQAREDFDPEKTKILVLTANAIAGAREHYLEEGFDDYLSKPLEPVRLEEALMAYLPQEKLVTAGDPLYSELLARMQEAVAQEALAGGAVSAEDAAAGGGPGGTGKDAVPAILSDLQGIDPETALSMCGGAETLCAVLKDFAEAIGEQSAEIERFAGERDWKNFTIRVHSLKSTARMIGAEALSEEARLLEGLGNAEDEKKILERIPGLLADYRAYRTYLAAFLTDETAEDAEDTREEIAREELEEAYGALREFAEANDFDSADFIIANLEDYRMPEEERERYVRVRRAVRKLDADALREALASAGAVPDEAH